MSGPHPVPPAAGVIALTVLVLPHDARDRYREEFRTELSELGALAQIGQAISLLAGSLALRQALQERDVLVVPQVKRQWRCRLGRHHYVGVQDDNPEMRGQARHHVIKTSGPQAAPSHTRRPHMFP